MNKRIILLFFIVLFSIIPLFLLFLKTPGCTKRYGVRSYNISNQWVYKFRYLDGNVLGFFKAEKDDVRLIHSSNLENGTISFQLFNSKDNLLVTFSANNTTDTIKDVFVKGELYKVVATATEAKGSFDFKME